MISDIESSRNMKRLYINSAHIKNPIIDLSILTQSNWPLNYSENQSISDLIFKIKKNHVNNMSGIENELSSFEIFYKNNFKGKILNLNLFYGSMEVNALFNNRLYCIQMSTIQGLIVSMLNNREEITISMIKFLMNGEINKKITNNLKNNEKRNTTNQVRKNPFVDILASSSKTGLLLPKNPIFSKDNESFIDKSLKEIIANEKINTELDKIPLSSLLSHIIPLAKIGLIEYNQDSQVVKINRGFYYSSNKIMLGVAKAKTNIKVEESNNQSIVENSKDIDILNHRKNLIDSHIIRIMKQKQRVFFEELCNIITDSLSNIFIPDKTIIKQRIENLTDRQFIKRADDNYNIYIYIA